MAKKIIHQHGTGLTIEQISQTLSKGELAIKTDPGSESIISKNHNDDIVEFIPTKRLKTINGESLVVVGDDINIEVTAGDSGVSVLDSTGSSSTHAISQRAATEAINSIPRGTVTSITVGDGVIGGGTGETINISHRQITSVTSGISEFNPSAKDNLSGFGSSAVVLSNISKDNLGHIISGKTTSISLPSENSIKQTVLPSGGTDGQVLIKDGSGDYSVKWGEFISGEYLPITGGTLTGDLSVMGKVTSSVGFFDNSDERLKDFSDEIEVDFEKLSKLRKAYFTFKDDKAKITHLGLSAQEVKELYPEIVNLNMNGYLSVDYSKLSVIALKAIDVMYEKQQNLEKRIEEIEKKLF